MGERTTARSLLGDLRLAVTLARAIPGSEVHVGAGARRERFGDRRGGDGSAPVRPLRELIDAIVAATAGATPVEPAVPVALAMPVELVVPSGVAATAYAGVYEARHGDQVVHLFATLLDPATVRRTLRAADTRPVLVGPDAWEGFGAHRPKVHLVGAHDVGTTIVAVRLGPRLPRPVVDVIQDVIAGGHAACLVAELRVEVELLRVPDLPA
jgi:hypothetical protein